LTERVVGVLSVHNEEAFLPFSLPNLAKCSNEVVVVLDRCTDESRTIVEQFVGSRWFMLENQTEPRWLNPCAEMKSRGLEYACLSDCKYVLMIDADVVLDCEAIGKAKSMLDHNVDCDLVSFVYRQYSLFGSCLDRFHDELSNLLSRFTRRFKLQPIRTGIYLVRKEKATLRDEPSEYDGLHQELCTAYVIGGIHLRPRHDRSSQLKRGCARRSYSQYGFWKVLVSSMIQLQPFMLKGFIQGKVIN